MGQNVNGKEVAVVIGATSKWQSNGRNTLLAHGHPIDDSTFPVGVRWGVGGAIAQKFAQEGFFVVLTTRNEANASPLAEAIRQQRGECMIVELDLVSQDSIANAFSTIRREAGDPDVLIYNAGIWKAANFRQTRNYWNMYLWKYLTSRSTSPVEDLSWSRKRFYPRCGERATDRSSSATMRARCAGANGSPDSHSIIRGS